jgi:hypothetical protein
VLCDPSTAEKNANKTKNKRQTTDEDEDEDDEDEDDDSELESEHVVTETDSRPSTNTSGEVRRGDYLYATSRELKMAASWCDGNIVTIISNADPSTISTVTRLVKRKIGVPALCIKEYNTNMQGVDRNDQIRARCSVADGHSFKKWYKKLGFAIVDIARVNAYLTQRLCMNDPRSSRDSHRQFMIELIQEMLNGKWQDAPGEDIMLFEANGRFSIRCKHLQVAIRLPQRCSHQVYNPPSARMSTRLRCLVAREDREYGLYADLKVVVTL